MEALSRELGVELYLLEQWKDKGLAGMDAGLKQRKTDPVKKEWDAAMKRVGEHIMENELLWERVRKPSPLPKRRSSK